MIDRSVNAALENSPSSAILCILVPYSIIGFGMYKVLVGGVPMYYCTVT